jgi:hypothetical protein
MQTVSQRAFAQVPRALTRRLEEAFEQMSTFRKLLHVPAMRPKYDAAEQVYMAIKSEVEAAVAVIAARIESRAVSRVLRKAVEDHNATVSASRIYTDEEVARVLFSGLPVQGSKDHLALAVELNMNYGSLICFIKQRLSAEGGKWYNCQDRVLVMMSQGDDSLLAEMRERNRMGYEEWLAAQKEKLEAEGA